MKAHTTNTTPATDTAPVAIEANDAMLAKVSAAFEPLMQRFNSQQMDVGKAKEALGEETEKAGSLRVTLMTECAAIATQQEWSHKIALQAIENVVKAYEDKSNGGLRASTLRQFTTELGRAIHPSCREHIAKDWAVVASAWKAEGDRLDAAKAEAKEAEERFDREAVDTPLRDVIKRQYHAFAGSDGILANRIAGNVDGDATGDDLVEIANKAGKRDRRDPAKAGKALTRALDAVETVAAEFPDDEGYDVGWDDVLQFLRNVDLKALEAKRKRREEGAAPKSKLRQRNRQNAGAVDATDALLKSE